MGCLRVSDLGLTWYIHTYIHTPEAGIAQLMAEPSALLEADFPSSEHMKCWQQKSAVTALPQGIFMRLACFPLAAAFSFFD